MTRYFYSDLLDQDAETTVKPLCVFSTLRWPFIPTQIVLPILHFDFSSYSSKFGVIFKDYEIMFSKYDYYDSKKQD